MLMNLTLNVTLDRKDLVKALVPLVLLVKGSPSLPLRQVRISAYAAAAFPTYEASFRAYNGLRELTISVPTMDATVTGTIALDVKDLLKFARSSKGPLVTIMGDGTVVSGALSVKLPTYPLADLPEAPVERTDATVTDILDLGAIRRVVYAMSACESRPQMHGVLIESDAEGTHTVATDGHRLAVVSRLGRRTGVAPAPAYELLIPYDAVVAILSAPATEAHASWGEDYLSLHTATYHLITPLSGEKFPPWRRVVPAAYNRAPITLPRRGLIAVLKSMGTTKAGVVLSASDDDGNTIVTCEERGLSARLATPWTGAPICVNPSYLRETIEGIAGETVTLELDSLALKPLVLRDGDYTAVVMPVAM